MLNLIWKSGEHGTLGSELLSSNGPPVLPFSHTSFPHLASQRTDTKVSIQDISFNIQIFNTKFHNT